jgi:hypothetical protein
MDRIGVEVTFPRPVRRQTEILAELSPLAAAAAGVDDELGLERVESSPHGDDLAQPRAEDIAWPPRLERGHLDIVVASQRERKCSFRPPDVTAGTRV